MPIFDQGYQHWRGTLSGRAGRWAAIARRGIRTQWDKKATKRVVIASLFPALALALVLVGWGLFEQKSSLLTPILAFARGLPDELRSGPRNFRLPIWTLLFNNFLKVQLAFSMLLVLIVGPDLISQDLRFNAMPLYFSRPLTRFDYFVGKLGVIAFYLGLVSLAPVVLAYVLGVAFSLDYRIVGETAWLLAMSLASGAIVVVSAGTLMLALSSLSKNARFVGGMWVMIWIIGNGAASFLTQVAHLEWGPMVSLLNNYHRLREAMLDTRSAWEPLMKLFDLGGPALMPRNRASALLDYPWKWSAILLVVLFGLSLCILSLRVRSLDRLK